MRKIGVFVAGGPAAGINGVIKAAAQEAENEGLSVVGFRGGARGLVENRFVHLTRQMVDDIDIMGGSILGSSRYRINPEAGHLDLLLANLRLEGIDGLISIGGEGTLQLADVLRREGVPTVHVPKTIDNDIAGVAQTFGFDTAVHVAARMLSVLKQDAKTTGTWFVAEIMGRNTGHLALEAGLAAGCTRVLIPEEGPINVPDLVTLIETRRSCGTTWGVILVAEATHFGDGTITRYGRLGGVSDALAERLEIACQLRGVECKIRGSNLGYFLRCAEPTGFDRSYAAQLGYGAVRFLLNPAHVGHMVTVKDDHLFAVPMEQVAGVTKPVDLTGTRYQALQAFATYEAAWSDLMEQRNSRRHAEEAIRWLDEHANLVTLEKLGMRLGVSTHDLLEALGEVVRSHQAGEAGTAAECPIPDSDKR